MTRWLERFRAFNADWNDLPRRLLWIVVLIGCLFLVLLAFPYVAPFVLAMLFAWILDPAIRFLTSRLGDNKLVRGIISGVFVLLLATLVIVFLFILVGRVFEEFKGLVIAMPGWITSASGNVIAWVEGLDLDWPILENGVEQAFVQLLSEATAMLTSLASRAASLVARGALRAASLLPESILFVVLTLMGTFYMCADKERIFGYLRSLLPDKYKARTNLFRASILRAVLGQIRAALIMLLVTFLELSAGFLLMGMDYAILLALVIALLDALPVIGAGLFLIPMALYGIIVGNTMLAVGAGLIYLTTIIVRQLLEPRIIGRQLGLYPLATMMAMYAGLKAMGFLGMLLGPLMLLLCKVALTADTGESPAPPARKLLFPKLSRKRKDG